MKIFGVDFSARSEVRDAPLGGMTSWGRFFSGWDIDGPAGAVSTAEALAVPAFWAGVNFLSASLAALPLHVYKVTKNGSERVEGGVNSLLQHAPNDETTSYAWRKYSFFQTFTGGRQFTWIERVPGRIVNLWPLDPTKVTLKRVDGKKGYCYSDGGRVQEYAASDVRYLHRLRDVMITRLEREGRLAVAEACFAFLPTRARLDLMGWPEADIFSHM